VTATPIFYSGSFFAETLQVYKDGPCETSGSQPYRSSYSIYLPGAGTYCMCFSLNGLSYVLPINQVDVFSSCTTTAVTLLGQTKTSGQEFDQFVLVVSCSGSGSISFPNGATALNTCFGSYWTSGSYCCCSFSIVQVE